MTRNAREANPTGVVPLGYASNERPARRWPFVVLMIALAWLVVATLLPSLNRRGSHDPRLKCASNLRMIGQGVQLYANANKGAFPPDVPTLFLGEDLTADTFLCYATNDTRAEGPTTQAVAAALASGGHLSYVYTGKGMSMQTPPSAVLAYEPLSNHVDGMHVLSVDGRVQWLDAKQGQKLLAELAAGRNPPRR